VFGHVAGGEQPNAAGSGPSGHIFGELDARGGLGDQVGLCQQELDLAADVGGVPRRPFRPELGDHPVCRSVAIDPAHRGRLELGWGGWVPVAEGA
jgi:hypothetical protein